MRVKKVLRRFVRGISINTIDVDGNVHGPITQGKENHVDGEKLIKLSEITCCLITDDRFTPDEKRRFLGFLSEWM